MVLGKYFHHPRLTFVSKEPDKDQGNDIHFARPYCKYQAKLKIAVRCKQFNARDWRGKIC